MQRMTERMEKRGDWLFVLALVAGTGFYGNHWIGLEGPIAIAWKGSGVALLALWAATRARSTDGWLLVAVLALGALGDVLIDAAGLVTGAVAFLAGHVVALVLYLRNRAGPAWLAPLDAVLISAMAYDLARAPGIAFYALWLGAMAGAAWASRFPKALVGAGALLFVASDLLIFARLGPLAASPVPGLLVWPTYFAGQALIAWGVARRV